MLVYFYLGQLLQIGAQQHEVKTKLLFETFRKLEDNSLDWNLFYKPLQKPFWNLFLQNFRSLDYNL